MTLRDRGGVCKDKAGILMALLRAAGLESYAGMTMAGERIEHIAADQFNHCVTVWRRADGKTQLLDPTWVPGRARAVVVPRAAAGGADGAARGGGPHDHRRSRRPRTTRSTLTVRSTLLADGTLKGTLKVTARRPVRRRRCAASTAAARAASGRRSTRDC